MMALFAMPHCWIHFHLFLDNISLAIDVLHSVGPLLCWRALVLLLLLCMFVDMFCVHMVFVLLDVYLRVG